MLNFWLDMPVMNQVRTVIRLKRADDKYWIEYRGDGYHCWTDFEPCTKSQAQKLHDGLEGWHACVLHAGGKLAILPRHPDYEHVKRCYEWEHEGIPKDYVR